MFLLSAVGCAFALEFKFLIISRLLCGIGVGMASVISPMFIAEFSPAHKRGRMIAYYQLAITLGVLPAYFSNALLLFVVHKDWSMDLPALERFFRSEAWRPMFLVIPIPSLIFFIMLLRVPESSRWLIMINRKGEAEKILLTILSKEEAGIEIEEIEESSRKTIKGKITSVIQP